MMSFAATLPTTASQAPADTGREQTLRFTLDGDAALEAHLSSICERIAAGVRGLVPDTKLEALLLGGGYGRGEGGVLRRPEGDLPYNDLEFYVCIRGNRHVNQTRFGRALHVLGEILTPQAGIDVEFHITSVNELRRGSVSMFSYDLLCGHRWLIGNEALLDGCGHHRDAAEIPLAEGTRLLMNRCSGLLFAAERLQRKTFTEADGDFVARNIAKAQLGAGDALLTAYGQYHWSVRERHRRLVWLIRAERADWFADAVAHHAEGLDFKLHPHRNSASREELLDRHARLAAFCHSAWMWLEHRRLGTPFRSELQYVESGLDKCAGTNGLRNLVINAKLFGPCVLRLHRKFRHPRERVLHALVLLLWQWPQDPATVTRHVQRELQTKAVDFAPLVNAYRELWARVN